MREDAARYLWICLGGAFGTGARYALSTYCLKSFGAGFPSGTLAVNLLGSFLLGAILQTGLSTTLLSPTARLALGTGVMGGFTTYSTFSYETFTLFEQGAYRTALVNVAATVAGCLVACALGVWASRAVFGR